MAQQFNLTPSVLTQALTHKSFKHGKAPSNERLQFVGHRSLEFFAMEANMEKTKSVAELKKAVSGVFEPARLATKFDALGLEAGVQCHLVSWFSDRRWDTYGLTYHHFVATRQHHSCCQIKDCRSTCRSCVSWTWIECCQRICKETCIINKTFLENQSLWVLSLLSLQSAWRHLHSFSVIEQSVRIQISEKTHQQLSTIMRRRLICHHLSRALLVHIQRL